MIHALLNLVLAEWEHLAGLVAAMGLALGAMMWLAGVRIARPAAALALGGAGFAAGYFWLPLLTDLAPLTGGLIGAAAGLAIGVLAFRFVQAAAVAACAAVIAAGVYYATYVHVETPPAADVPATWAGVQGWAAGEFSALSEQDRQRLAVAGIGAGVIALVAALGFPRATTLVASAAGGAGAMMACTYVLLLRYWPAQAAHWPAKGASNLLILGLLFLIGAAVQWRISGRRADKASMTAFGAGPRVELNPA